MNPTTTSDKTTKKNLLRRERGATMVEYAVILALFAALIIGAITLVTTQINESFDGVVNELENPPTGS